MEEQAIRFTAAGGRRIAWASSGSGPPLVLSGFWMSHLELNWRDPRFRAYIDALARHRTVIRYDSPGTGLSADGPLRQPYIAYLQGGLNYSHCRIGVLRSLAQMNAMAAV